MSVAVNLHADPVATVLHEARQAHLAVATVGGPHVTPVLYAFDRRRLWFLAASPTVKARTVATGSRGAALVTTPGIAVVFAGTLERLDPLTPSSLVRAGAAVPSVPAAVARFAVRNAVDLLGFVGDAVRGRAGRMPPHRRVLLALRPERLAVVDDAGVVAVAGDWPGEAPEGGGGPTATVAVPSGTQAVVGWDGPDGPLALPGRWDAERGEASVLDELAALTGTRQPAAAAVVFDDYGRPGPAAKRGVLLRGRGSPADVTPADGWRRLRIEADRRTSWDGIETTTDAAG